MRIAIVGAGIAGITTAHELAVDGHQVTVLEQQESVAAGASFAHSGLIAPALLAAPMARDLGLSVATVFLAFSALFLKEQLTWNHLVGFALIAAGAASATGSPGSAPGGKPPMAPEDAPVMLLSARPGATARPSGMPAHPGQPDEDALEGNGAPGGDDTLDATRRNLQA